MIKSLAIVAVAAVAASTSAPLPAPPATATSPRSHAQAFVVDGVHSSVLFRVQHLKAAPFWGRFNEVSGKLMVDDDNLGDSYLEVEVPTGSVDSNDAGRDRHLKSQDFFAAKEFPTLTFKSTKIEKAGDDEYRVTGDLTLRGKTNSVTFDAVHTGTAEVSDRFGLRCGYEATLTIDRTEFGIDHYAEGGVLGKDVRIIVALEGKLPE